MYITSMQILAQYIQDDIYEEAEQLICEHRILRMKVEKQEGSFYIRGTYQTYYLPHEFELYLDEHGYPMRGLCTCYHRNGEMCAHVSAAIMILAYTNIKTFPAKVNDSGYIQALQRRAKEDPDFHLKLSEYHENVLPPQLVRQLKQRKRGNILLRKAFHQAESMFPVQMLSKPHLQVRLGTSLLNGLSFRFAIGDRKLYLIKKIQDFLSRIDANETFQYGKNLSFQHTMDAFDAESRELITFLNRNYYDSLNQDKECRFHGRTLDAFGEMLGQLDEEHCQFAYQKCTGQLKLSIRQKQNLYEVKMESLRVDALQYGIENLFVLKDDVVYAYRYDAQGFCVRLIQALQEAELYFNEVELYQFYDTFIKPYPEFISLDSDVVFEELLVHEDITLYLDLDEQYQIEARLSCESQNELVIPFQNEQYSMSMRIVMQALRNHCDYIAKDTGFVYFDPKEEKTQVFLQQVLPQLQKYCEVMASQSVLNLSRPKSLSLSAGVKVDHHLLEVKLDSIQFSKEEIHDILKAYRRKKKYHRLKDGQVIDLEAGDIADVNEVLEALDIPLSDVKKGHSKMPLYRSFQLEELNHQGVNLQLDQSYHQLMQALQEEPHEIALHPRFDSILRDYQKDGARWLLKLNQYHLNGILADDMGLGKSVQVIAMLESIACEHPSLIVVPASLLYNWMDEFEKFQSPLSVLRVSGTKAERTKAIAAANQYDVLVTSYDYLRRDIEQYEPWEFTYVILDEAQYIKNQHTQNAQCVKQLKSSYRLALSGTPIENSLAELWSIFDFLMQGYLYGYKQFSELYERPIVHRHDKQKTAQLQKLVSPFILRRTKKEVLKELPDKVEVNLRIDFEREEEKLYVAALSKANQDLANLFDSGEVNKMQILAMMTRLRQLCCEPRTVYENHHLIFSKLKRTVELCHSLKENGQKILLFSSFTTVLELIAQQLHKEGFTYLKLTGADSKEARRSMVQSFQEGNADIFLISLKAGGTGLNLTAASAVIHYDPWWNLSAQNQASDRAYRIGQESKVTIYRMVMANSIEEKIVMMQQRKQDLADLFVEGREFSLASMNKEEILKLFQR